MKSIRGIRTFYILLITQTLSFMGSQMTSLAVGIWVFNETQNATPLAFAAFFGAVPRILSTGFGGVFADRWNRRRIMIATDTAQAIATLFLLGVIVGGSFELWHLYTVAMVQALFGAFQQPAFSASVAMLVPEEQRDRANAIRQLTGPTSGVIAMVLSGLLFSVIGVSGVVAIDLATFVVAVLVVSLLHIPQPEQTQEGAIWEQNSVWKEGLVGFRYLRKLRPLFVLVVYISFLNFLVNGAAVLTTPYIIARTNSEAMVGILMGLLNGGAIVGSIAMGVWGGSKSRARIHTIMIGIIVFSVVMMLVGVAQTVLSMGIVFFLLMMPLPTINALFASILQAKVPPDLQGRVFATTSQMSMLMTPLAYLIVGPLVDGVLEPAVGEPGWETIGLLVGNETGAGMGLLFLFNGLLVLATSAMMYAWPMIRTMETDLPDYHTEVEEKETENKEINETPLGDEQVPVTV